MSSSHNVYRYLLVELYILWSRASSCACTDPTVWTLLDPSTQKVVQQTNGLLLKRRRALVMRAPAIAVALVCDLLLSVCGFFHERERIIKPETTSLRASGPETTGPVGGCTCTGTQDKDGAGWKCAAWDQHVVFGKMIMLPPWCYVDANQCTRARRSLRHPTLYMANCVPVLARPPALWSQTLQARTTSACVCDGRRDEADAGWRCQRWPEPESGGRGGHAWCFVSYKCGVAVRAATDPRLFWAYCRQHDAIEKETHNHLRHRARRANRVVTHHARSNATGARSKAEIQMDAVRSVRA